MSERASEDRSGERPVALAAGGRGANDNADKPSSGRRRALRLLRLLLVDDDDGLRAAWRRAIGRLELPIELHEAEDGAAALALLREGDLRDAPLIVVSDLHMPRVGGLALLEAVRKDPRLARVPVVLMSSSDQPEDARAAYALHAAGYFVKSRSLEERLERIETLYRYWTSALPSER